ncbi:MAG: 23S rRNA (pseudouridine(1915)-N(3))-methyltransferase RlmH [Prevotella sp.]|nr:23S rRNA (pseudouridine(1915)-N(3))-methyltransferase RlmH [Prevotella sp.]
MKTELLLVGKTTNKHIAALLDLYTRRITRYMPFAVTVIPELKNTKSLSEEQQRQREGRLILRHLQPADTLVLLDERGKELRSIELAQWLTQKQLVARRLLLAIGGPYGFSGEVCQRANEKLSLSRLTFSHQTVRAILAEQIYRACTIIKGEPYHHE